MELPSIPPLYLIVAAITWVAAMVVLGDRFSMRPWVLMAAIALAIGWPLAVAAGLVSVGKRLRADLAALERSWERRRRVVRVLLRRKMTMRRAGKGIYRTLPHTPTATHAGPLATNPADTPQLELDRSWVMRYCTQCGDQIPVTAKFCPRCGREFEVQEVTSFQDCS